MTRASRALVAVRVLAAWLAVSLAPLRASATMPTTFDDTVGNAVLCRSHLDNRYFYTYLETYFGKSYKHEGGAYWFKTPDTTLWGTETKEVWVSDDTSEHIFIGALNEAEPDQFAIAIRSGTGIRFTALDASKYPLRVSGAGSTIAYVDKKSKIYCVRYKPIPAG